MLATTMRSTTNPPNPSSTVLWGLARSTRLAAVMAWGKRPEPFRTRKLSPTAPMVLHLGGCGRVGHHRNTTKHEGPPHHQVRGPHTIHHPTHNARHHQRQLTPKPPPHSWTTPHTVVGTCGSRGGEHVVRQGREHTPVAGRGAAVARPSARPVGPGVYITSGTPDSPSVARARGPAPTRPGTRRSRPRKELRHGEDGPGRRRGRFTPPTGGTSTGDEAFPSGGRAPVVQWVHCFRGRGGAHGSR